LTAPATYPRLPLRVADSMLAEQQGLSVTAATTLAAASHPQQEWHPTIPDRVTEKDLQQLRSDIVDLAVAHGYPAELPRGGYAIFEQELAMLAYQQMNIVPAEAAVGGIWSFLALVLLPDVTAWRWPSRPRERFIGADLLVGNNRHAFGRLWARAYVLGNYCSADLIEDNMVQVLERSTFGGDPRLARTIAYTHLRTLADEHSLASQNLMRDAMKRLRRLALLVSFSALTDNQLAELLDEVFAASRTALLTPKTADLYAGA
jgi:hypothetical protein